MNTLRLAILTVFVILSVIQFSFAQVDAGPTLQMCTGTNACISASVFPLNNQYIVDTTIAFAPIPGNGKFIPLGDDKFSDPILMGFKFNFFGVLYDTLYISSNGFITFRPSTCETCFSAVVPSALLPNALIACAWADLNPNAGGKIEVFNVAGACGTNAFVINFISIPHYGGGNNVTQQIILFEGSNAIEIHTTAMPSDGTDHTMGIENETGSVGYWRNGRNSVNWSASNDAVRFQIAYDIEWTTNYDPTKVISTSTSFLVSPIITTTYYATVEYPNNTIFVDSVTLLVFPAPSAGWTYTTQGPLLFITDKSTQALLWDWDFDDGNNSTQQVPVHHFLTGGIYNVRQVVTNSLLCRDTLIKKVDMTHLGINDIGNVVTFRTYPNPFAGETTIRFGLENQAEVKLEVFNIFGVQVAQLFEGEQGPGKHSYVFNSEKYGVSDGLYILKLTVDGQSISSRLVNLK